MMKKLILLLAVSAVALTGKSQILSSPVWDYLQKSNVVVATYGIYGMKSHDYGVGIGVGYKLSEFVVPTIRFDYIGGRIWQPSASLQLQTPVQLFNKSITAIPFVFDGIATPITGKKDANFDPVNIAGLGVAIQFKQGTAFYIPKGVIADYERWTGAGWNDNQVRAGMYWKF